MGALPVLLIIFSEVGFLFGIAVAVSYGYPLISHTTLQARVNASGGVVRLLYPTKIKGMRKGFVWRMAVWGFILAVLSTFLFLQTLPEEILWVYVSSVFLLTGCVLSLQVILSPLWKMWQKVTGYTLASMFFALSGVSWYLLAIIPMP